MFLDRKPYLYVWRPLQRTLFAGLLWPFLGRVKAFFLAETSVGLNTLENRLGELEQHIRVLERQNELWLARCASLEAERRSQWDNIAKLLLCLYQQPKQ